jgi:broad specificity phosphatase PhoE
MKDRPFYFLRHGQTDWNRAGLCVGQSDQPLNNFGIEQARAAALFVAPFEIGRIYHSTLRRAVQTASIIGEHLKVPLMPDAGLREVCFGVKQGLPESSPTNNFISEWVRGGAIEGAETAKAFNQRIAACLISILSNEQERPPLIVAHSGVFMGLAVACNVEGTDIEHCRPYRFEPSAGGWTICPSG